MNLFCFLILHYNSIEDTEDCIASIKGLNQENQIKILIVDNHSPNQSGTYLYEKYKNDDRIKVIITEENHGFSKGNNIGCEAAVREWNPDFLIVANNDIVFVQPEFLRKIEKEYSLSEFDILGPDIYDPYLQNHQNPMDINPPSAAASMKTIFLNSIVLLLPKLFCPLLKTYFESPDPGTKLNSQLPDENVVLQGSCLIYSKKYLQKKLSKCRNMLFFPETHFYYEEYIQTVWCRRNGCKTRYSPSLLVHHLGGRSTASAHTTSISKMKFRIQNIRGSAIIYLKFLKSER